MSQVVESKIFNPSPHPDLKAHIDEMYGRSPQPHRMPSEDFEIFGEELDKEIIRVVDELKTERLSQEEIEQKVPDESHGSQIQPTPDVYYGKDTNSLLEKKEQTDLLRLTGKGKKARWNINQG